MIIVRILNLKSDTLSSVNLSNGTKLDLGSSTRDKTSTAVALSLLVLNLVNGNSSGLPTFVFISDPFHSYPSLTISDLFPEAIFYVTPKYLYIFITLSCNDFENF